jgi:O-antigen/teichoic acid export membrane protein
MSTASTPEAVGDEKIGLKIARNTLASAVGRFWSMAVSFLLTPYIVNRLGDGRFGIRVFPGIFLGYFAVVGLGVSLSVVKYGAGSYTFRDFERLNRSVNSAFVAMALLMGTLCLLGVAFSRPFLHLLKISPQNCSEAHVESSLRPFGDQDWLLPVEGQFLDNRSCVIRAPRRLLGGDSFSS